MIHPAIEKTPYHHQCGGSLNDGEDDRPGTSYTIVQTDEEGVGVEMPVEDSSLPTDGGVRFLVLMVAAGVVVVSRLFDQLQTMHRFEQIVCDVQKVYRGV